jgi:hypothetical protein
MTQASRLLAAGLGILATCLSALADLDGAADLPEPGSIALVGLAIVALVYFGMRKE